jgi:hypothetical protein
VDGAEESGIIRMWLLVQDVSYHQHGHYRREIWMIQPIAVMDDIVSDASQVPLR